MKISGTGSVLPEKVVTNDMLSQFLDTSDEWIVSRTGVRTRHVISHERLDEMAVEASRKALDDAGLSPDQLDFIICSNVVNEYVTPQLSCIIQGGIGAGCPCIDINCACAGFIYALQIAEAFYQAGKVRNVLVVCAEEPTRMTDWTDRRTCVLFGDGAAAVVLTPGDNIRSIKLSASSSTDKLWQYRLLQPTPYITKAYPDAKVIAGEYVAQIFQRPTAKALMRDLDSKAAIKYGASAYEDLIDQLKVDITVKDGDSFRCGDFFFTAIALPGHTHCSYGFYLPEHKLLLGSETLGVYFGYGTYLPFFLVGYQLTLDSFAKVRQLNVEKILLPHYGVVDREEAEVYLENSEESTREIAQTMLSMLKDGKTNEEILAFFEERDYRENVRPTYPIDAFHLNTSIMIEQIRKELLK